MGVPPREMPRGRWFAGTLSGVVAAAAILVGSAMALQGDTVLVSKTSAGIGGDGHSITPSISADGRYVAFSSGADNLSDADNDGVENIFVHDVQTGMTTLVSKATGGTAADSDSYSPSISADGRYVAFESDANNLADDNDFFTDVFVHDLQTGTTTLVSRPTAGGAADDNSFAASISADGLNVSFTSRADNLSDIDLDDTRDVFVNNVQTGTTTLVSKASDGTRADSVSGSTSSSMSDDGRYVAFSSGANNLSTADDDSVANNVFVHDLQTGTTTLVSIAPGNIAANGSSTDPSISAEGRFVAFASAANNLADADTDIVRDVFVHDLQTGTTTLASKTTDGTAADGTNGSTWTAISADGRYVAFQSPADNLSTADDDSVTNNVFVHDLQTGTTTLVSIAPDGTAADGASESPAISADGTYVAFDSNANNLSDADDETVGNVFRHAYLPDVPPQNIAAPAISGEPTPGSTLSCDPGEWSDGTFSYAWRRDGSSIAGASTDTYIVTAEDAGHAVDCQVTATNAVGSTQATSSAVTVAATPPGDPDDTKAPDAEVVGKKLAVNEKGVTKVQISCPADEASGPCVAEDVSIKTQQKVEVAKKRKLLLARQKKDLEIPAGETKKAKLKLSKKKLRLVRKIKPARKVTLSAVVADQAGNRVTITKKAKLVLK